jgi:hypothetical protein
MERDRLFQQGRLIEEAQRLENERIAHILGQDYQAFLAANAPASSPYPKFGRAPVFPPGPVPVNYKTKPAQQARPAAAIAAPSTPAPRPASNSRSVHPGVVAVIVLVAFAILVAIGYAVFKRTVPVTPAEMGIQTTSTVTWSQYPEYGDKIQFAAFEVVTTNTSSEERTVTYCARQYPDSGDACIAYKVPPQSAKRAFETRSVGVGRGSDAINGPNNRVVKIDGRYVTD